MTVLTRMTGEDGVTLTAREGFEEGGGEGEVTLTLKDRSGHVVAATFEKAEFKAFARMLA